MIKTSYPNAVGECSIPGQGAKIPHTSWAENQNMEQKQQCNKFNKDLKNKQTNPALLCKQLPKQIIANIYYTCNETGTALSPL